MAKASTSKAKGRRFQQQIRDMILDTYPVLEPDDVRSTAMGQSGEDIQLSPAARKLFPFSVEAKSRKSLVVYPWYQQAKANAKGYTPVLFVKQDRSEPLVILSAEDFFKLCTMKS